MSLKCVVLVALLAFCGVECDDQLLKEYSEINKQYPNEDCSNNYTATCLKLHIVSWVDKLNENDEINLISGVSVIRENGSDRINTPDLVAKLARDFPSDVDARLDVFLMKKFTEYLNNHSIRLNPWRENPAVGTARRRGGNGGNGGGGGGNGGMLLAAGGLMKGTLLILALGGLAVIAGKALLTGIISLVLSTIIGLKALTSHHKTTTYEIVSKPIYTHSNTHSISSEEYGHGGYGHSSYERSFDVPIPLGLQPHYQPK
ncbi:hypothetical protein WA026_008493 [Henosepilachna vigintioctopunctata]|uniref:Osiris 16 n=1 Tax=Henosepilachna vigintioctopunctata TaxID=420089 RepID=A0AAW1UGZ0_9CUCU